MKKISKRVVSVILSIALGYSMLPTSVLTTMVSAATDCLTTGDIITFGSYPQTKVTDLATIDSLNLLTFNSNGEVMYNNIKYKRVYLTSANSQQVENGYYVNTVYWFRYEPVQWRVLSNTNGELFVISVKILDSKAYYQKHANVTWETCTLRTWLNNDFYNSAFAVTEKPQLITSNVINDDNPWYGTEGGNNTNDKLFLLSYNETINHDYGFNLNYDTYDISRKAQGTDFSKSSGLKVNQYSSNDDNWWLRSPGQYSNEAGYVVGGKDYNIDLGVDYDAIGVRPVLKLKLSASIINTISSQQTATTVNLNWNAVTGATGYNVYRGLIKVNDSIIVDTDYLISGLSPSIIYSFRVIAVIDGLANIGLEHKVTTCTLPPSGLTSAIKTTTIIKLTWNMPNGAQGYNVYNGTMKINPIPIYETTYTVTDLSINSEYSFIVKAINAGGESESSNELKTSTLTEAPSDLAAINKSNSAVTLSWDSVIGATAYNVYKGTQKLNNEPITDTTFIASDLYQNTSYAFTVKAINSGGESAPSISLNISTLPDRPYGLTLKNKTASSICLTWNSIPRVNGYNLYNGSIKLNASPIISTIYNLTNLSQGTAYSFSVKSIGLSGESEASTILNVTTLPVAPEGLTSTSTTSSNINLLWKPVSKATGYLVYKGSTKITNVPITDSKYKVTGLMQGTIYSFTVKAVGAGGDSVASTAYIISTLPSTPTSLKAKSSSYNSIKISWSDVSGTTGYEVYRATSEAGTYLLLKTVTAASYTDKSLTTGKVYYYKVRAYKTVNGNNLFSALTGAINSKPLLASPGSFSVVRASRTSIKISWAMVTGANGYDVYRATSSTGQYSLVKGTTSNSFINTGLVKNKYYYYKVRAYRTVGGVKVYSTFTSKKSAKPY